MYLSNTPNATVTFKYRYDPKIFTKCKYAIFIISKLFLYSAFAWHFHALHAHGKPVANARRTTMEQVSSQTPATLEQAGSVPHAIPSCDQRGTRYHDINRDCYVIINLLLVCLSHFVNTRNQSTV